MKLFSRVFTTVILLALLAGAVAVVVLAWTIPNDSISALRDAVDWLSDNNDDLGKSVLTLAAVAVGLVCLTLLVLQFVPASSSDIALSDIENGSVVLSTAAIAQRIDEALREVPNLAEGRSAVKARKKAVEVSLDLQVDPDANLAAVSGAACDAARRVLSEKVHVALAGQPRVRLHYRELRLRGPARAPAPAPAPSESAAPTAQPATPVESSPASGEPAVAAITSGAPDSEGEGRQNGT